MGLVPLKPRRGYVRTWCRNDLVTNNRHRAIKTTPCRRGYPRITGAASSRDLFFTKRPRAIKPQPHLIKGPFKPLAEIQNLPQAAPELGPEQWPRKHTENWTK